MGGHCVEVIGYSEPEQCWIIKNSWNTTWGMNGFGKIAYTDLVFDGAFFPMYGVDTVIAPPNVPNTDHR
jgi:C1A family cysteine protease